MALVPHSRSFLGRFSIYMGAGILQQLVGLALLPFFSAILMPAEIGTLGVLMAIEALMLIISDFALASTAVLYYHQHKGSDADRVIGRLFIASVFISILVALVGFVVIPVTWSYWSSVPVPSSALIAVVLAGAFVQRINNFSQQMYRTREQAIKFGINAVARTVLLLVFSIAFVGLLHLALLGIFLARLLAALATAISEMRFLIGPVVRRPPPAAETPLMPIWQLAAPLLVHQIANWGRTSLDRIIMSGFVDAASTGIYYIAALPGVAFSFLALTFDNTFAPWYYRRRALGEEGFRQYSADISSLYLGALSILCLLVMAACPEIFYVLFPRDMALAGSIAPLMLVGQFLGAAAHFFIKALLFHKRTDVIPLIGVGSAALGLSLMMALIGTIGIAAGAVGLAVTNLIVLLGAWFAVRRIETPDFSVMRSLAIAFVLTGFAIFVHGWAVPMQLASLAERLTAAAACSALILLLVGGSAWRRAAGIVNMKRLRRR